MVKRVIETTDIFAFGLILILVMATILPSYVKVSSNEATLNVLSLDEWAFFDYMRGQVIPKIRSFSPTVLLIKDNWGYGSIYYMIFGLVSLPAFLFSSFSVQIISLRIISLVFLALALFAIYKILRLEQSSLIAVLGSVMLLLFPGFHFFWKPFSAEFISLSIMLWGVYFFLTGLNRFKKVSNWSFLLFGVAAGIKLLALPSITGVMIYLLLFWRQTIKKRLSAFPMAAFFLGLGFLLANPFTLTPAGRNHFLSLIKQNLTSNSTAHGQVATTENIYKWYFEVIDQEYMPVWLLGLMVFAIVFKVIQEIIINKEIKWVTFFAGLFLINLLYITLNVKTLYYWYLFPAFAFILPAFLSITSKQSKHYIFTLLLIIIFQGLTGIPRIVEKHSSWRGLEKSEKFLVNKQSGETIADYITSSDLKPRSVLKTAYLYLDQSKLKGVIVNTEWGYLNEKMLTSYMPDLIIYQKNYGIFFPDTQVSEWTSYQDIVHGREVYNRLLGRGIKIGPNVFKYSKLMETEDAIVLKRV